LKSEKNKEFLVFVGVLNEKYRKTAKDNGLRQVLVLDLKKVFSERQNRKICCFMKQKKGIKKIAIKYFKQI